MHLLRVNISLHGRVRKSLFAAVTGAGELITIRQCSRNPVASMSSRSAVTSVTTNAITAISKSAGSISSFACVHRTWSVPSVFIKIIKQYAIIMSNDQISRIVLFFSTNFLKSL